MDRNALCARLAQRVTELKKSPLLAPVPGIRLLYADQPSGRTPVMYPSGMVILFQGQKTGYLGNQVFHYDATKYLILTVTMPFECETFATEAEPLVGLLFDVDTARLQDLLIDIGDDDSFPAVSQTRGIHTALLTEEMLSAADRLLGVMENSRDARVLGPQIVREILYYMLLGPCGAALLAMVSRQTQFSQIARAVRRIEHHYTESLSVDQLAAEVNMSVSAFHHNFKAVTSTSPLQYLKNYRLHKARTLMIQDGLKASTAAMRVGYESASQFSREFKRYFGLTPGEEMTRARLAG